MAIRPNLTVAAVVATTLMALAMGTTLMALAMILIASSSQVHDRNTSLLVFSLHSPFIFSIWPPRPAHGFATPVSTAVERPAHRAH